MTRALHPAVALILMLIAVGLRIGLDLVWGAAAGDVWQRGLEVITAAVLAGVVLKFSADDPPRRPWLMLLIAMALMPVIRLLGYYAVEIQGLRVAHLLLIFANFAMAFAVFDFGRVLGSSDLLSDRTTRERRRVLAMLVLLTLAGVATLVYNTMELSVHGLPQAAGAWLTLATNLVSTVCDVLVFAGGLYLVWLLRPLVGGSLARPYLLLAIGAGAFLVVDVLLAGAGAAMQSDLATHGWHTLVPKWIGCLAYSGFGMAAATQLALLSPTRRA